jgi:hypothetical protein
MRLTEGPHEGAHHRLLAGIPPRLEFQVELVSIEHPVGEPLFQIGDVGIELQLRRGRAGRGGGRSGWLSAARIVLRSCPVSRAISLMETPLPYSSRITKRSSARSIVAPPRSKPVDQTILPGSEQLD